VSKIKHSPLPWEVSDDRFKMICDSNGITVADYFYKKDAAFIVNCVNSFNPEIERIVRDAVVSYGEMFPSAPNDSAENELCYRAKVANDWLKSIGAEPEPFHYVKEGGAK
jgi:hypothetical protein